MAQHQQGLTMEQTQYIQRVDDLVNAVKRSYRGITEHMSVGMKEDLQSYGVMVHATALKEALLQLQHISADILFQNACYHGDDKAGDTSPAKPAVQYS